MKKLFFKSTEADLQKFISLNETIHKNVLYLTYQVDFIRKWINTQEVDKGLQKQTLDYYETSPQTELEDK